MQTSHDENSKRGYVYAATNPFYIPSCGRKYSRIWSFVNIFICANINMCIYIYICDIYINMIIYIYDMIDYIYMLEIYMIYIYYIHIIVSRIYIHI